MTTPSKLSLSEATTNDIGLRQGNPGGGFCDPRFLELYGARIIEPTAFEPDPRTYRGEYYYNAVTNQLFRKVISRNDPKTGIITANWVAVSH